MKGSDLAIKNHEHAGLSPGSDLKLNEMIHQSGLEKEQNGFINNYNLPALSSNDWLSLINTKCHTEDTKILVVDDDKNIRKVLRELIKGTGYHFLEAGDAGYALEVLEEHKVDVMITDIRMPGQNGIELTRIVKEKYDSDVIVMTGYANDMKYEEVIGYGARDFMQKPFNTKEMVVRLKRVIKERAILSGWNRMGKQLNLSLLKLTRVLEQTVNALASALEKRDPYTAGHQQRVTNLVDAISHEMGLPEEIVEGNHIAALLHDIGKISIPIDILNKPGKLNKHEFNLIKDHPSVSYEILKNIEFDQPVAQIILQHHERMNGTGYPHGLSGEDILLQARILAVSDVVEAMASHRPYRPALGIDIAIDEISTNKDVLYDSVVVDACLALFNEKRFTFG